MSWTIVLENEKKLEIASLEDEFETDTDLSNFKLLCYLDKYGDTIFNHLQMKDLINDLKNLKILEINPLIDEIIKLAIKCKEGTHIYLVFYGD